jgi:hypothetical protein
MGVCATDCGLPITSMRISPDTISRQQAADTGTGYMALRIIGASNSDLFFDHYKGKRKKTKVS